MTSSPAAHAQTETTNSRAYQVIGKKRSLTSVSSPPKWGVRSGKKCNRQEVSIGNGRRVRTDGGDVQVQRQIASRDKSVPPAERRAARCVWVAAHCGWACGPLLVVLQPAVGGLAIDCNGLTRNGRQDE